MSWLFEDPWPVIWITLVVEALLAAALFNTQSKAVLAGMLGVLALAGGLLLVERLVVTETEEVEQTLHDVAEALETNDVAAVLTHLAPDAAEIRFAAQGLLPSVNITEAEVGSDLSVRINPLMNPPTATARFMGKISMESGGSRNIPYEKFIRPFSVTLRKEGDRWLLTGYKLENRPGQAR
jgi:hypothetical protein